MAKQVRKKIPLSKKQIQALRYLSDEDKTTTELCYGGAARGGKSWLGNVWQISRRMKLPGSVGLIAREELTKLKDTTLRTFFKVSKMHGWDNEYKFNHGSLTAEFHNGSVIFFREIKWLPGDAEYDRLGSFDLTDCFIDEAQQIRKKAIDVLKGRFSVLDGDTGHLDEKKKMIRWHTIPKALYTCNPKRNWIYSDFVFPASRKELAPWRKFIKALPQDNPYVDQAYIDNLMKADKVTVQRLLYGNFEYEDDPTLLVDYDAVQDLFTNDHVVGDGVSYISADLAMQGRDSFVAGSWNGLRVRVAIDQQKSTGKSIEQDLKALMNTTGTGHSNVVVDSDGLGSYLDSYLTGIKTFHAQSSARNSKEYANFKSECGYKLAELVNKREIKIICTPQQKQSIVEELHVLKAKTVDDDETRKRLISKDEMKEQLQRSPDYLDMLLMRMYFELMPKGYNIYSG